MPENYNLKSLRLKKTKKRKADSICMESRKYPWGLEINLNNDSLTKLGEKADNFTVGTEIYVLAKAKVTGVRQDTNERDNFSNIVLQITDMKLQRREKNKK